MSFRPEHEIHKRRLGRNLGVGLLLVVFVGIVFGLTVVKVLAIGEKRGFDGVVRQETTEPVKTP
jgi:hypothetical protein